MALPLRKVLGRIAEIRKPLVDPSALDQIVSGVTSDSREVKPGAVFVAVQGGSQDGHDFIGQVQQSGAIAIVGTKPAPKNLLVPYIQVQDSREALAELASNFYDRPSHSMTVVGVTGTSGKTTMTYLIESLLKAAGYEVGVIGTINFRHGTKVFPSTHTTPGSVGLQKLMHEMKQDGCDAVVMEVSSHALKQKRADFVAFDAVVFTNLSPEHLDFHPDMEDYFRSKAILFTHLLDYSIRAGKRPFAAINGDDPYGQRLMNELSQKQRPEVVFGDYGFEKGRGLSGVDLKFDASGINGNVAGIEVRSPLIGKFNGSNLLAAIMTGQGLLLENEEIAQGIASLQAVPGRLERVPNSRGINILVDYAHKPDALEKVLQNLRDLRAQAGNPQAKIITVVGCGGDRDRKKRPIMGKISVDLSDQVFITSDNPRTEDPNAIIEEILKGVADRCNYVVEPDRRKAIHRAVQSAKSGDIILIAGKGHEDYQIIGKTKIHFDDREVAAEALSS